MAANRNDRNNETGLSDLIRREIVRSENPAHLAHLRVFAPQRDLPEHFQTLLSALDRAEDDAENGVSISMRG